MQLQDLQTEIEKLELELAEKEILLEKFLNKNEGFKKSRVLLHEINVMKARLEELKKLKENQIK